MRRIVFALLLPMWWVGSASAQEAGIESHPAPAPADVEVFVTAGTSYRGAIIKLQQTSLSRQRQSQLGAAFHLALGEHWAGVIDVATSAFESFWKWDGGSTQNPDDNFVRVRRVTIAPSVVRTWRIGRMSAYFGGGIAVETQAEFHRYRDLVGRVNTRPVLADSVTERRGHSLFLVPIHIRGGVVAHAGPRLALRCDYKWGVRYFDEPTAHSLDVAVGYRFTL